MKCYVPVKRIAKGNMPINTQDVLQCEATHRPGVISQCVGDLNLLLTAYLVALSSFGYSPACDYQVMHVYIL